MFSDENLTTEKFQIAICAATSIAFAGLAGIYAIKREILTREPTVLNTSFKSIMKVVNRL